MALSRVIAFAKVEGGFPASTTLNVDTGSASDRVAYVVLSRYSAGNPPVSVTVGGQSLTARGSLFSDSSSNPHRLYAGAITVTGAQDVVGTWDNGTGANAIMYGVIYSGVDTAAVIEDLTTTELVSTTPSWTIDSATGDIVAALFLSDANNTLTASSPATAFTGTGYGSGVIVHGMDRAGSTSVTIDGTITNDTWRGFGFNVPAAAVASSKANKLLMLGIG